MLSFMTRFLKHQATSGLLLMVILFLALFWANSRFSVSYFTFQSVLVHPVNDGLMTLFFLLMGLEIKRETLVGELSTRAKAWQPVFAALGGMILPALFFLWIAWPHPEIRHGWAIPCATDIPFALGVLALLGARIPRDIKVLLMAIAIIDDLGAILIIALFYAGDLIPAALLVACLGMIFLAMLNFFNNRRLIFYLLAGCLVWLGFYKAGLHPTLAGVVTAFSIPYQTQKNPTASPLLRLEHVLHRWVAFGVLPLFALINTGVSVSAVEGTFTQPLSLAVGLGLFVGKPLGIMGGLILGHIIGMARKPDMRRWRDYAGLACLCGIGFTMALFIGGLAFDDPLFLNQVKLSVLSASLLSAAIGWTVSHLTFIHKKP